ncbi:hypothetical protein BC332_18059 [Capsicum chinense]|nr:hypothetical protein BC332_18059 [Capsicum chinense]
MKVPFQGRTTYYDTFHFFKPCFGLWFDGCTCKKSGIFCFVSHPSLSQHFRFTSFLRSQILRYDIPSSLYRSYSRFIPLHCYDVLYSNSGDSQRSIALFTSEWHYLTYLLVGDVFYFR